VARPLAGESRPPDPTEEPMMCLSLSARFARGNLGQNPGLRVVVTTEQATGPALHQTPY